MTMFLTKGGPVIFPNKCELGIIVSINNGARVNKDTLKFVKNRINHDIIRLKDIPSERPYYAEFYFDDRHKTVDIKYSTIVPALITGKMYYAF